MIASRPVADRDDAASHLRIGRISLSVRIAAAINADWPAQWADADRFRRETAAILDALLSPLLDDGDPSVWILRRLDLSAFVDGGGRERAALGFATALRQAIARALRGEDGGGIVRFANRAAYLARLLTDVARGDAHERWYHFRYRHLRPLPTVDALAHIFAAHAGEAPDALAEMHAAGNLPDLLDALGDRGAARVMAMLASGAPAARAAPGVAPAIAPPAVRSAVARWGRGGRARLALFAGAAHGSGLAPETIAAAVETLVAGTPDPAPPPPRRGAARPAGRRARRGDRNAPALAYDREERRAGATAQKAASPSAAPAAPVCGSIETPFAGVFLLWRSVVELGLDRLLLPGPEGGLARLTLAATLAGREWRAAFADPALHWLTGFEPPDAEPAGPDPGLAAAFARHMAAHFAPRPLRLVDQRHDGVRVVQDEISEDWIHLRRQGRRAARPAGPPAIAPIAAASARPIGRDLDFFGIGARRGVDRLAWVLLARAAFADLGRRLFGLERSSAAYLAANVTAGGGRLDPGPVPEVILPRAPLDLVLRMTGIDGTKVALSDGRAFRLKLPGAG